jgi:hypothetical protein
MMVMTAGNPFKSRLSYLLNLLNHVITSLLGVMILVVKMNESQKWFDEIQKQSIIGVVMVYSLAGLMACNVLFQVASMAVVVYMVVKGIVEKRRMEK